MSKLQKSIMFITLTFLFILTFLYVPCSIAQERYSNSLLKVDIKKEKIGLVIGEEHDSYGPMSFFVCDNKEILICDTINKRILKYLNGKLLDIIDLSSERDVIDICVDENGIIYLLSESYSVIKINTRDKNMQKFIIPKIKENSETTTLMGKEYTGYYDPLFINVVNAEIYITFCNNIEYLFNGVNLFEITKEYQMHLNGDKPYCTKINNNERLNFYSEGEAVLMRHIKKDKLGRDFIELNSYYGDAYTSILEKTIRVLDSNNKISYVTLYDNSIYSPNREVCINSNGEIYQMIVNENSIDIQNLLPKETYVSKIKEYKENKVNQEILDNSLDNLTKSTSYISLYHFQVVNSCIGYTHEFTGWIFNSIDHNDTSRTDNPSMVTQPDFLSSYNDGNDHSISCVPYCWGGDDSTSSFVYSVNYTSDPYFAGNICSNSDERVGGTAGVDCSGFVSRVFYLPYHHTTKNMMGLENANTPFELKGSWNTADYLDILLKQSHVIVANYKSTVNGITGYWGFEATTSGDDCVQYKWNNSTYLSNFNVYRYLYWRD